MNSQSATKRTRSGPLLPAAAGFGPLLHVFDGAEGVRDSVLAAMPYQQDVDVGEFRFAVRAAIDARPFTYDVSAIPVRSL